MTNGYRFGVIAVLVIFAAVVAAWWGGFFALVPAP
jgi:hypothetical protein